MRVISKRTLERAWTAHADAKGPLEAWYATVSAASWAKWVDVQEVYPAADRVGKRIVFNIKGNRYRLIVGYHFPSGVLYVKWFGTHAEYDKIDVATVEYDQ